MLFIPPLRERVIRSHSAHGSIPCQFVKENRPARYKQYEQSRMLRALNAVREGQSIRRAALEYGLPKSTLGDRMSGRVTHGTLSGPPRYLSSDEEEELVRFLLGCSSMGYAKSRKEVFALVQGLVVAKRGLTKAITSGWWESFCRRHPNLTLRAPAPLSQARVYASDRDVIARYFDLLEHTLVENDLHDKPCQLFNMDETGMPLDPKSVKCVFARGVKNPVSLSSGNKSQITVVACVSAAGYCIPPMVVWDRKHLSDELIDGEVPGTFYGFSDNGWMDQELFDGWLCNHFLRYAPPTRPVLLLLDGHSSHYSPCSIRTAANEQIIIFALPPHTTHLSQPLDRGCFAPLKVAWRDVCHQYMADNPGKVVTRYNFSKLLSKAWMTAMTMANITSGFRVTGVYPVNRDAIDLPAVSAQQSLPEATGLAYIPLYSPAKRPLSVPSTPSIPVFSEEELLRFQTRFENGYDIKTDERYNRWLQMYHPGGYDLSFDDSLVAYRTLSPDCSLDTPSLSSTPSPLPVTQPVVVMVAPSQVTGLKRLLANVPPPPKPPQPKPKASARVLTSSEHLKAMKEKEQQKQEAAQQKEERKRQREEKARLRAEQQEECKRRREEKARLRGEQQEECKRQREEKARLRAEQQEQCKRQREEKARLRAEQQEERMREEQARQHEKASTLREQMTKGNGMRMLCMCVCDIMSYNYSHSYERSIKTNRKGVYPQLTSSPHLTHTGVHRPCALGLCTFRLEVTKVLRIN